MKLGSAIPLFLAGIVFGIFGVLLYQNSQESKDPVQQFANLAPEQFSCTYTFAAFEILQNEDLVEAKGELQFANFAPKEVVCTDTLSRASFYTVPKRQSIQWKGKFEPTLAQISTVYTPYLQGAKLFKVEDLVREDCNRKPPEPEEDLDTK